MDFSDIILKRHPRARHVKIKASLRHGIEVVVPMRFNQKLLPEILERNRAWIEKRLTEIQQQLNEAEVDTLPTEIKLSAIDQTWKVIYTKTNSKRLQLMTRSSQEIVLLGNCDDFALCKKRLMHWVKEQAEAYLIPLLKKLSVEIQVPYRIATIRSQQTRWGSCSADKSINLNYKLIFLTPNLVNHIFIHELAHTVHMNHSAKFWKFVESFDADWKQHRFSLRKADAFMPGWIIK